MALRFEPGGNLLMQDESCQRFQGLLGGDYGKAVHLRLFQELDTQNWKSSDIKTHKYYRMYKITNIVSLLLVGIICVLQLNY